jgi:hypothetical protein
MARTNRRWSHGLFPIDEALLERLLDCQAGEDEAWEDSELDDDPDGDAFSWQLEEDRDEEDGPHAAAPVEPASPAMDDVQAVNMRVLNDYLRRRLIEDDPEPIARTLH